MLIQGSLLIFPVQHESENDDYLASVAFPQYQGAPVGDMIADPLDCIFGYPESIQEIKQSDNTVVPSRRRLRAYKRRLRRHQAHHESTDSNPKLNKNCG